MQQRQPRLQQRPLLPLQPQLNPQLNLHLQSQLQLTVNGTPRLHSPTPILQLQTDPKEELLKLQLTKLSQTQNNRVLSPPQLSQTTPAQSIQSQTTHPTHTQTTLAQTAQSQTIQPQPPVHSTHAVQQLSDVQQTLTQPTTNKPFQSLLLQQSQQTMFQPTQFDKQSSTLPQTSRPRSPQQLQHSIGTNKQPLSPTNGVNNNSNVTIHTHNSTELKKRGIHRRDLVKGSTALPPNMAFVPKKCPSSLLPSSESPLQQTEITSSSLISHKHSPDLQNTTTKVDNSISSSEVESNSVDGSASVVSLGGVSLRGINTQRRETIGVIGSGKNISSPQHSVQSIQFQALDSLSQASDPYSYVPDSFSFLTTSTISPSSLFSSSRSPLHLSSPLPLSNHITTLHNSSPLPNSTYDLFASSSNPLFGSNVFDSPPPDSSSFLHPPRSGE
jgi:hypothetical protein